MHYSFRSSWNLLLPLLFFLSFFFTLAIILFSLYFSIHLSSGALMVDSWVYWRIFYIPRSHTLLFCEQACTVVVIQSWDCGAALLGPRSWLCQEYYANSKIIFYYFTAHCLLFLIYKMETMLLPTLHAW